MMRELGRLGGRSPRLSRQFLNIFHSPFKKISLYFDLLGARRAPIFFRDLKRVVEDFLQNFP